jgi:P pilus assembly chaperone PapD
MSLSKPLLTNLPHVCRALSVIVLVIFAAAPVGAATTGVGVGTGKIRPDAPFLPGLTYTMPSIAVFNSGDTESDYEMTVQYNETQPELKPPAEWVTFTPQHFTLKPGRSQEVKIFVQPSSTAAPGQYFIYLEARPVKKDTSGITAIKIAAATKFNFEVAPANDWQRFYYILLDFWNKNQVWLIPVLSIFALFVSFLLAKKFFKLERRRKKIRFTTKS